MRKLTFALPLLIAGCTVGPELHRPEVAGVAAPWIEPATSGPVDNQWWQALQDPQLDALIDAALAHNLDIREAEAHLMEARANRDVAAGGRLPSVNATASATETSLSKNGQIPVGQIPGFTRNFGLFDGGFDASWELDLWGGTKRAIQAASARGLEAEARRNDARVQVIAEVARAYVDVRATQAQLRAAQANVAVREDIAALYQRRVDAGESPSAEVETARQQLDTVRAALPALLAQQRAAIYRLALLTGQPPEAMLKLDHDGAQLPATPVIVPAGIRSELLQRRPDIRAAEANLAAATADIGAAKAQLYPRFAIIGSLGQQGRSLSDLTSGSSTRFAIGPSFSWPIFEAGKIHAQARAADARAQAATARYEKAVLGALNDSETALNRYGHAQTATQRYEATHADAERLAALAGQRFKRGEDDRIHWLEAQSNVLVTEQSAVAAHADALVSYIAVSKALGGGWNP